MRSRNSVRQLGLLKYRLFSSYVNCVNAGAGPEQVDCGGGVVSTVCGGCAEVRTPATSTNKPAATAIPARQACHSERSGILNAKRANRTISCVSFTVAFLMVLIGKT